MKNRGRSQKEEVLVEDVRIELVRKDIKNLHLSVHPPAGQVRITAPRSIATEAVVQILKERLDWIRERQKRFQTASAEVNYISGEIHLFRGERLVLNFIPHVGRARVVMEKGTLDLFAKGDSSSLLRERLLQNWYRTQLRVLVPPLMSQWEARIGVKATEWGVKRMRTKWGTCNVLARRIWLSLELAKKPPICLEYVVVHELVHLLERSHNARFKGLMDRFLPSWRTIRSELNGTLGGDAD